MDAERLDCDAGGDSMGALDPAPCEPGEVVSDGPELGLECGCWRLRLRGASAEPDADELGGASEDREMERLRRLRARSRSAMRHDEVSVLTRPYSLA